MKAFLLNNADLYVYTRASLADPLLSGKPTVVLTGAWPQELSGSVVELDSTIDCRYVHLDREAERLAELAGGEGTAQGSHLPAPWVNVLGLRYYLLKLLRVVEHFSAIQPLKKGTRLCVIADRADRDDVQILTAVCSQAGASCEVRWQSEPAGAGESAPEREEWWRKALQTLASCLPATVKEDREKTRVVLCGNPRFLDSLGDTLLQRGCCLWWLYDRIAVKPFLHWYLRGVPQLTCQENRRTVNRRRPIDLPPLEFRGIDLRGPVRAWLTTRLQTRWEEQERWEEQIDRHFCRLRPDLLVMDEDATPMKRIALAAARRYGGKSYVIQHGAPVARFGFAPLAADGLFAWGQATRDQLARWDIPPERVFVTGSPTHDALCQAFRKTPVRNAIAGRSPRILLLATVSPRDTRPDLIEMNMNSRSYGEMIEAAFAAAESIPGATLAVKPHPRSREDAAVLAAAARHPGLRVETIKAKPLPEAMRGVDCVLSCLSSAGIEATLAGVPVIQLVPRGAGRILSHDEWGLLGSASSAQELLPLIQNALQGRIRSSAATFDKVFANTSFWEQESSNAPDAATRIADILLKQTKQNTSVSRTDMEQGCSEAIAGR
ncbi:MAG: UDP-N-acetyl glucosamine 2-epimerase [Planctomycetaceae bacterium]|mgnify:CR=1 FL=1|nr:UDP-N-acetyl glucosamine 2-epimerase [Planctomycetaceae bacterium]